MLSNLKLQLNFILEIIDNNFTQYLKMKTTPTTPDINPEQWYISTTNLSNDANEIALNSKTSSI